MSSGRRKTHPIRPWCCPGKTTAFTDTPIYARTSGYLKTMVFRYRRAGEAGRAACRDRDAGSRRSSCARRAPIWRRLRPMPSWPASPPHRTEDLLKSQSVSTQERDNAAGADAADKAIVQSRQADVARLEELQTYEKIYAPFDGVITARNTDIGELISAGAGTRNTRAFPHVRRPNAAHLRRGARDLCAGRFKSAPTPSVTLDEYPGQPFSGNVSAHRQGHQPIIAHAPGRGRRRQCRGQDPARRLHVRAFCAAPARRQR